MGKTSTLAGPVLGRSTAAAGSTLGGIQDVRFECTSFNDPGVDDCFRRLGKGSCLDYIPPFCLLSCATSVWNTGPPSWLAGEIPSILQRPRTRAWLLLVDLKRALGELGKSLFRFLLACQLMECVTWTGAMRWVIGHLTCMSGFICRSKKVPADGLEQPELKIQSSAQMGALIRRSNWDGALGFECKPTKVIPR
jgi:hypothetical protein